MIIISQINDQPGDSSSIGFVAGEWATSNWITIPIARHRALYLALSKQLDGCIKSSSSELVIGFNGKSQKWKKLIGRAEAEVLTRILIPFRPVHFEDIGLSFSI